MLIDDLTARLKEDQEKCWDLESAVEMCRLIEPIAPIHGAHVALTGGCLYKDGRRKDVDILFYRIRQVKMIDEIALLDNLKVVGFKILKRKGWVVKASYEDKPLDFFFPEELTQTINGKCIDNQYPEGPVCPTCNKERFYDIERLEWYHSSTERCLKDYPADAEGIKYFLKIDPGTGNRFCPICEKQLYYSAVYNMYRHHREGATDHFNCKNCGSVYYYIDGYQNHPYCLNCTALGFTSP